MPNIQINNLPLYTGDTTGSYLIINNSGETTTYKTTLETLLLSYSTPQFNEMVSFWNTYVGQPYTVNGNGILYKIESLGTGSNPIYANNITINYTAKLMNNTIFDSGTNVTFPMSGVIQAFQIILQQIKQGGGIKFVSPSQYCYGVNGISPTIPPNSPLYFSVDLLGVS
jgi:hypothetical protein